MLFKFYYFHVKQEGNADPTLKPDFYILSRSSEGQGHDAACL